MKRLILVLMFIGCCVVHAQQYPPYLMYDASGNPYPSGSGTALPYNPPPFTCYTNVTGQTLPCNFSGGSSGTVTSVALNGSGNLFSATPGTPVTGAGDLNVDAQLATQTANCVVAGPSTGSAAQPTCRALVAADIPSLSTTYLTKANNLSDVASATTALGNLGGAPTASPTFTGTVTFGLLTSSVSGGATGIVPVTLVNTFAATSGQSAPGFSDFSPNIAAGGFGDYYFGKGSTAGSIGYAQLRFTYAGSSSASNTFALLLDGTTANWTCYHAGFCAFGGTVNIPTLQTQVIDQFAASNTGGTCAMVAGTSCTITIAHTYTTPICIVTQQSATLTGGAAGCTVSGVTVTITSAVLNSETWGALIFGNPT